MRKTSKFTTFSLLFSLVLLSAASAQNCGSQGGGKVCASGQCCSKFGWCGKTNHHCGSGNCESQCPGGGPSPVTGGDLGSVTSNSMFDQMLKHRNENSCQGKNNFYSYNPFITASRSFPGFGTSGDINARKREIAAFFAQTSHETTGGWPSAPDGPNQCFKRAKPEYLKTSSEIIIHLSSLKTQFRWTYGVLVMVKTHRIVVHRAEAKFVRRDNVAANSGGAVTLMTIVVLAIVKVSVQVAALCLIMCIFTFKNSNYNYGPCGRAIGVDLLNNPDLAATDPVISFKTAIWFWMTPQSPKPSGHDVIIGRWNPSAGDRSANRLPGFGVITNIINGGLECGRGNDNRVQDRIGFYRSYCGILGVSPGDNLDCGNQRPFGS
ncbi:endochitinase-like [Solanum lycopersicum]|uniref:endochitinase-like n=1 Tax=Solanum lycopersicum TaxID=4081 RepID=UPI003748D817